MLRPPILRGKEDKSGNWGFNVSLPIRLGISCSLIKISHVSKFSIVLGVVLLKNEAFLDPLHYSRQTFWGEGGGFSNFIPKFCFAHSVETRGTVYIQNLFL